MTPEELVNWARDEADDLRSRAEDDLGRCGRPLEFLRVHAGEKSSFYKQASTILAKGYGHDYRNRSIASLLVGWAELVEQGLLDEPLELRARVEASTDLMEQVEALLTDPAVHPAAPVMLAGAALEEFLRGLVDANDVKVKGKAGLNTYAAALHSVGLIAQQDLKDVTSLAGTRNDAAHGNFDKITVERARLMADHINLFLRQEAGRD